MPPAPGSGALADLVKPLQQPVPQPPRRLELEGEHAEPGRDHQEGRPGQEEEQQAEGRQQAARHADGDAARGPGAARAETPHASVPLELVVDALALPVRAAAGAEQSWPCSSSGGSTPWC